MSIAKRFEWLRFIVAANPRPTVAELAVAIEIAKHFNEEKGAAWPSSRHLAEVLRMERRNVRRALTSLEERGLIRVVHFKSRSKAYALAIPEYAIQIENSFAGDLQAGATEPPIRGLYDPLDGRPTTPSMGAAQPPEQVVSRSEAVGILHTGANARSADAARAGAGKRPIYRRKLSTPVRL